jgi:hypothetical protein
VHNTSVTELLKSGLTTIRDTRAADEVAKRGMFRGGSVGLVTDDGVLYGKCARLAYLRSIGVEETHQPNVLKMFDGGESSEARVLALLAAAGVDVRSGESVARNYQLADGTTVSCRPDGVVYDAEGKAAYGLELKACSSIWTVTSTHYDLKPKSDHLVQAGHYALLFGRLPFKLVYSSWVDWHVSTLPKFLQTKFVRGQYGDVYDVEYKDDGTPLKIRPFDREYDLRWDGPVLTYQTAGLAAPVRTLITEDGVRRYYEAVAALRDRGVMPPRPTAKSVDGSKAYKACDYCELATVCARSEHSTQLWIDDAKTTLGGPKQ